jgi:hypothetical protein
VVRNGEEGITEFGVIKEGVSVRGVGAALGVEVVEVLGVELVAVLLLVGIRDVVDVGIVWEGRRRFTDEGVCSE